MPGRTLAPFDGRHILELDGQTRVESYQHALSLLYERINYEKIGHAPYTSNHYRLDRMRSLLEVLGTPQDCYLIVHIAGTKGKGTTSTLLYDCLRACGKRTGLYTSPHLLKLEERFVCDGQICSESELVDMTRLVLAAAERVESEGGGRATFFELTTAIGMLHFARQGAEWVVLETGMGGRLDSTNVCLPEVAIITSISLDHQAQLGDTIEQIAGEKAGIIKPHVPVVCSARDPRAQPTIAAIAESRQAPLHMIGRNFDTDWNLLTPSAQAAEAERLNRDSHSLEGPRTEGLAVAEVTLRLASDASVWPTRLLGRHQADNFAAALVALDCLRQAGHVLPPEQVRVAIAKSAPRARLEVVGLSPARIIDTAHNPASIRAGLDALLEHYPNQRRVIVFASSRDKDHQKMLADLMHHADELILTAYRDNPRALPARELFQNAINIKAAALDLVAVDAATTREASQSANSLSGSGVCNPAASDDRAGMAILHLQETPQAAWRLALQLARPEDIVMATGSFFLAAELLPLIEELAYGDP